MAAGGGWALTAGRAIAAGRVLTGVALLVAPGRTSRAWIGDVGPGGEAVTRCVGIRDLVMGGITLHTIDHPQVGPRWVATCALADAVDAVATYAARRSLPPVGATGVPIAGALAAATRLRCVRRAAHAREAPRAGSPGADRHRAEGRRPGAPGAAGRGLGRPSCWPRSTGGRRRSAPPRAGAPRCATRSTSRRTPASRSRCSGARSSSSSTTRPTRALIADKHPAALGGSRPRRVPRGVGHDRPDDGGRLRGRAARRGSRTSACRCGATGAWRSATSRSRTRPSARRTARSRASWTSRRRRRARSSTGGACRCSTQLERRPQPRSSTPTRCPPARCRCCAPRSRTCRGSTSAWARRPRRPPTGG